MSVIKTLNESAIPTWDKAIKRSSSKTFMSGDAGSLTFSNSRGEIEILFWKLGEYTRQLVGGLAIFPSDRSSDSVEYTVAVHSKEAYEVLIPEEGMSELYDSIISYIAKKVDFDDEKNFVNQAVHCLSGLASLTSKYAKRFRRR